MQRATEVPLFSGGFNARDRIPDIAEMTGVRFGFISLAMIGLMGSGTWR